MNQMGYTFAVFSNAQTEGGKSIRVKGVTHFSGRDIHDIMKQAAKYKHDNPEHTLGAAIPGIHSTVP